jgi:1-aminocyclopropane-1-carboxylate deaminase/D-cysteine desulfhydrase-like pyridoxal-dependent ACC family enzyme
MLKKKLLEEGRKPYVIPVGGSTLWGLGILLYYVLSIFTVIAHHALVLTPSVLNTRYPREILRYIYIYIYIYSLFQHLVDKDPGLMGNLLVERLVGAHIDLVSEEEYAQIGSEVRTLYV